MPHPTRTQTCGLLQLGAYIFQITFSAIQYAMILQCKPSVADPHTFKISQCIKFFSVTAKSVLHNGPDAGL